MWDCVFTPASVCSIPNQNSETNISQGKTDYTVLSTIFHYVWIFVKYQYIVLYNKGKGAHTLWKGEEIS
jgi:hypothetical protein